MNQLEHLALMQRLAALEERIGALENGTPDLSAIMAATARDELAPTPDRMAAARAAKAAKKAQAGA